LAAGPHRLGGVVDKREVKGLRRPPATFNARSAARDSSRYFPPTEDKSPSISFHELNASNKQPRHRDHQLAEWVFDFASVAGVGTPGIRALAPRQNMSAQKRIHKEPAEGEGQQKLPLGVKLLRSFEGHEATIMSVAFDPTGGTLASGSRDNTVRLCDVRSGKLLRTLGGHKRAVTTVAFDPHGEVLASGSEDTTVKLWDVRSGKLLRTFDTYAEPVTRVAFAPQGSALIIGLRGGALNLLDMPSGKPLKAFEKIVPGEAWSHAHPNSIAFKPSTGELTIGTTRGNIKVWQSAWTLMSVSKRRHREHVGSIAFNPMGSLLASGSGDSTINIWDAAKGKLLRTLEGHRGDVSALAFSPNGKLLASCSTNEAIRLWSCETWETVAVIPAEGRMQVPAPLFGFHPTLPLLATTGGTRRVPFIQLLELDIDLLLRERVGATVTYTSAKVVLVGESNVGKSYLAHRIATGGPPKEGAVHSTHGMKFWPLKPAQSDPVPEKRKNKEKPVSAYTGMLFGQASGADQNQRRDIILWDMGGQEEYRLVHQLFLHDTTVALLLLDPKRGATAFKEVEAWNKSLEKHWSERDAVKLLVGAKVDQPSEMIDRQGLKRLRSECGFVDYCETSAITGRGVAELCEALAKAIDWDGLGKTSRPALFQRIRDEIEVRRKRGEVVLSESKLHEAVGFKNPRGRKTAVHAVAEQLAAQGIIARSRLASGKPVLVLQIQEIERYAGSLILAARKNLRGVPALELRAVGQARFPLPGIDQKDRLPRKQERTVVECTVQLMLEHGICFEHEGLLIFPSLFPPAAETSDAKLPHAVSLYYDFAGAIDNIYASLVAWLVLAKEFGKVRLWPNRAEFELKDRGLCGLLKQGRPGGFAHVDVYFEKETPERKQKEFISFVEDHLVRNGVEIREHVKIKCPCGHQFAEETLRQRIARGDKDVGCPGCDARHSLMEGAKAAREQDAKIAQHTWALRTKIEKRREKITKGVVQLLANAEEENPVTRPIRLLHLSDLHFNKDTLVPARLQSLVADIRGGECLGFQELDYVVISGDFTDQGCSEGFEKAYEFASGLSAEFGLSAERFILVPGNHDVKDLAEAFEKRTSANGTEVIGSERQIP
jgi:small GTP-binding protein